MRNDPAAGSSDAFIRHVAHDLRASLNAVVGWAELVKTGQLGPDDLTRAGETVVRHARQLSQRLGDALDLWRLDIGLLEVARRPASVAIAARAALEGARAQFDSRRVECRLELTGEPSALLDAQRFTQALTALLSDAAANTPAGDGVDVVVGADGGDAVVRVVGGGRMPDVGWRDRNPAEPKRGASVRPFDFALALADALITLQGGTLAVEAAPADRVAFVVRTPSVVGSVAADPPEAEAGLLKGLRVLVVDDQKDARDVVERLLRPYGAVVTCVPSVDDALETLRSVSVDVLVSDIAMPDRDGYDLIQSIRSDARLSSLPAAALTAFTTPEDRTRAIGAGFHELLSKPVQPSALFATLASLCRKARATSEARDR